MLKRDIVIAPGHLSFYPYGTAMEGKIKKRPYDLTLINVISVHAFKLLKYMTVKQKLNHIALI